MTTTRFEDTQGGQLTTLADEATLLDTLEATGRVTVQVLGLSTTKSLPVRLVTVRLPTTPQSAPGVLVISLQHGNEVVGRESAISQMRDLAEGSDPETLDLLSRCQVHFITAANPAGFPGTRLVPGVVIDLNKSHLSHPMVEPRYVQQAITMTDPVLMVDCHEWPAATADQVWMLDGSHPMAHPEVATLSASVKAACSEALDQDGIAYADYPGRDPDPGLLRGMSAVRNCPFLLVETSMSGFTPWHRHTLYKSVFRGVRTWLLGNVEDAAVSKQATKQAMTARGLAANVPFDLGNGTIVDPPPSGYTIPAPGPAHLDVFGMHYSEQDGTITVPMDQPLHSLVPFLLDPEAPESVVAGTRMFPDVPPPPPLPTVPPFQGVPIAMKVRLDGVVYEVEAMKVRLDGVVHEASLPAE